MPLDAPTTRTLWFSKETDINPCYRSVRGAEERDDRLHARGFEAVLIHARYVAQLDAHEPSAFGLASDGRHRHGAAHGEVDARDGNREGPRVADGDARAIRDGGGNGSIIGRNTFQRPKADALKMLDKIISIYLGKE